MSEDTDFSKLPKSLGEHRAERQDYNVGWSPREVLIYALRKIDSGELNPDVLIVGWSCFVDDGKGTVTSFAQASPNVLASIGLIDMVKFKMLKDET